MLVVQERHFQPQISTNIPINTISYTRGNDLSGSLQGAGGIGGLLARTDHSTLNLQPSTAHAYYHADGNGNITAMVNTNGAVVARYQYDPYGNLLGMAGPLAEANTYRFSSKEWHANAGLYYYGFRYYEPNLQRWLNRDPIQEAGGINLYGFVFNDPLRRIDPFGLDLFGPPGDLFSDPKNPERDMDDAVKEFGKKCGRGLWDLNKDEIIDWGMNKLFFGKIGLCYDNLKDCVKDTVGLKLPSLDAKQENLKLDWPFQKQKKEGKKRFSPDLGLGHLGMKYRPISNLEFGIKAKFDRDGLKYKGIEGCNIYGNLNF